LLLLVRLPSIILNEVRLVLALAVTEEEPTKLHLLSLVIVGRDLVEPEAHSLRVFFLSPRLCKVLGGNLG